MTDKQYYFFGAFIFFVTKAKKSERYFCCKIYSFFESVKVISLLLIERKIDL